MISRNRRNSFFFVWFLRRGSIYNPKHKDHHDEQWKNRRTKCDRRHRCSMVHSSTTVWSFLLPPPASPPLVSLCRAASSAIAIVRTFFFMLFVKILDELAGPRVSVHVGISTEAEGSCVWPFIFLFTLSLPAFTRDAPSVLASLLSSSFCHIGITCLETSGKKY